MAERYFPGFEFRKFEQPKPNTFEFVPVERTEIPNTPIKTVTLDDLTGFADDIFVEPEPQIWTPRELQQEFVTKLGQIDKQIGCPRLTMRRRTIKFVTRDEMRPKTDEEREWLVQRYGDYATDGGEGACARNPDGTFTIRIGYAGQEDTASKDDVLGTMGHEYGHTLGKHIDDAVLEELKAYTFANLFMKHYYNVSEYRVYQMDVSTIHNTALFWLEQLLDREVCEEAILAHLTGKKFGNSSPNDYLNPPRATSEVAPTLLEQTIITK